MKFYTIPPNNHLDMMDYGERYFALAHHYIQDLKYQRHFLQLRKRSPRVFITLDNGAAEHSLVTEDVLLKITAELKPDEVIAPDVLFNKDQTISNFKSFVSKMGSRGLLSHTSVFACPQGSTKQEWLECYEHMVKNPFVSCIGLSKIAVPKCWNNAEGDTLIAQSRNECVKELQHQHLLIKPIHLLGMGEHNEFDYYLEHKIQNIRSSDSCYAILAAINGIDFNAGNTTRIPTTNEYFNAKLTEEQKTLAKNNIEFLKTKYRQI
jgi:hypothetical protein